MKKYLLCLLGVFIFSGVQARELVVALGEIDYPPFYFVEKGELKGVSMEIAKNVAERLGHTFKFHRTPWARVITNLKKGKVDMVIHFFNTAERAPLVIHTGVPHIFESSYLFIKKGRQIPFSGDLTQQKSYQFGNVRGYSHGQAYDTATYLKKMDLTSEENLIKMVAKGKVDIGVGNKPTILMHAAKYGLQSELEFLSPVIDEGPCYMAFSREKPYAKALAAEFTEEIIEFKKTNKYRQILETYHFDFPNFKKD